MRLSARKLGDFAVGDALRQAFYDGGLAHARFADQHRIVLGAAAQDLNHPLQFLIASDQRIELAVHGGLRQVAAELTQQRRLARALRRGLLLRGARQLFPDGGKTQSTLVQDFGGEALLLAEQSQQQVLGADVLVGKPFGFLRRVSRAPVCTRCSAGGLPR